MTSRKGGIQVKRIFLIVALLGCTLLYLGQVSFAQKMAHREYAKMAIGECNECHKSEGISPNHEADFVRHHRVLASRGGNNCGECHDRAWCLDCHQGGGTGDNLNLSNFGRDYKPKSHRSDFINIHPIKALDNPQNCYRCHDERAFCNSCHSRFPRSSMRIRSHLLSGDRQTFMWTSEHAIEARRNLQSCQSCHPDGDVCLRCHSATSGAKVSPHPRGFKTGNRNNRTCRNCH